MAFRPGISYLLNTQITTLSEDLKPSYKILELGLCNPVQIPFPNAMI